MSIKIIKNTYWIYVLFIGLSMGLIAFKYIAINISPSMSEGLYLKEGRSSIKRGDNVLFCLPKGLASLGLNRGYLFVGQCPGHTAPLVKEVVAIPGDNVLLTHQGLFVNGVFITMPQLEKDEKGRAIPSIQRGMYSNTKGYWLLGTTDVMSWDSRYWGPLNASLMKAKVTYINV